MSQSWAQFVSGLNTDPGSGDTSGQTPDWQTQLGLNSAGGTVSSAPSGTVFQVPNSDGTITYYDAAGNALGTSSSGSGGGVGGAGGLGGGSESGTTNTNVNATGGVAGSSGGLGNILQSILGSGTGQGGSGLGSLLAMLAPAIAGIYSANKTGQATSQVLGGIQNASNIDQQLLGAPSAYAPYTQAGQNALTNLSGMSFQPLNYGPLGGRALTLGNIAAAPTAAATTKGK